MEKKKILLVDDDEVFVEAVTAVLEEHYRIDTAANGTEALEKVRQGAPDLVVLDVMMEHLSEGFDVARTLRSDSQTKGIPIIMLTGVDQVYDMTMEAGRGWVPYDRYLEKPVSPEDLVAQVKEMIG